ncbi:MAG: DUF1549 domain-containing protein, partial [Planctomycetota bacterium]
MPWFDLAAAQLMGRLRCLTSVIAFWLLWPALPSATEQLVAAEQLPEAEQGTDDEQGEDPSISFHRDIKPIFRAHCVGCHQNAKMLGEYLMTDFSMLISGGESGEPAIIPGDADASFLVERITPHDGVAEMPEPPAEPLHDTEIDLIRRWIDQGAIDDSPTDVAKQFSMSDPPDYEGPPTLPSLDVSPDGRWIAVAGYHEVHLIDITPTSDADDQLADAQPIRRRLIGESPRINSVAFSPDGTHLAVAGGTTGENGELQCWDVSRCDDGNKASLDWSVNVTFDAITGASWSPDGTMISIAAADNSVRAFDAPTGDQVLFQGAHEDWVRGTVFTNDASHIVSVARDMTCKLTEVATQRFVDNVTSITPGALSGGLTSIAIHPERDEIVVGGADGVVKAYRVFRQTKRQIGDDANLIRQLPKLDGRIRDVSIDPSGTYIAAAATLDGRSEIGVWQYNFSGDLTAELKQILSKRVSQRSAKETAAVTDDRQSEVPPVSTAKLTFASVYAIEVTSDGGVWCTTNDGRLRHLNRDGQWDRVLSVVPDESTRLATSVETESTFDPAHYVATNNANLVSVESVDDVAVLEDATLSVSPAFVYLSGPYAYTQLLATATLPDGSQRDVTNHIAVDEHPALVTQTGGVIRAKADAMGELAIRYGDQHITIPFQSVDQANAGVDFIRDVNPVLSRLGCNQGTCHGAQKGKNGFRLSLRGYDPIFDLRSLTDDLAARRINPAAPEHSLMLRKPLGITPHQGGTLMRAGDPYHAILRRWIADGSQLDLTTPRVTAIEIAPENPVVQATDATQHIRIVARYADGATRDVTHEAFIESGNTEVATVEKGAVLQAVRRGEAPVLARYEGCYAATTLTVMGTRDGYKESEVETWNEIDHLVAQKWQRMKIVPSGLSDDATFLRRVHLDLTGLPPTSDQVRAFLADPTPTVQKRSALVDDLIGNEAFVEYWTNKWADLLQVNRKFLGVEGSKAYRGWIREAVQENRPLDQFAREILTASGSTQANPPASYYKVLRTPEDAMENTTHLFLGIRFNCNKCHDHPFERWTQDQYYEMAAFFARVTRKRDPASGKKTVGGSAVEKPKPLYEFVQDANTGEVKHARTG